MRVLSVVSTFPPHFYGGGEVSAINQSDWLAKQGHEIGVITTAGMGESELFGRQIDGLHVWRLRPRRLYTYWNLARAPSWQKPLWHLQDHLDPNNRSMMARVIEEFKPECVNIHVVSGIGYNALYEIGNRNLAAVYFMHDLNLVCAKGSFFKNGEECSRRCRICKIVCGFRIEAVRSIKRLRFCSPSRAIVEKASQWLPDVKNNSCVVLNTNQYPRATVQRVLSDCVRFLFVGRMHITKGVHVLLEALEELADTYRFILTIVGTGPEEEKLRDRYGSRTWCAFTGFVQQEEVSNLMALHDALCIPSIWIENSPGVVIQALSQGLPVIGSNKGGIPELVHHGENGLVIRPGDVTAWREALTTVLRNPGCLEQWRRNAVEKAYMFDQDLLGQQVLKVMYAAVDDE